MTSGHAASFSGDLHLRDATDADHAAIVALNAAVVADTSPMDAARLRELAALADHLRVATLDDTVAGFLLAMPEGCGYANANFAWFSARLASFAYIDRVVVDARFRGHGIGQRLYADLFDRARARGAAVACCEINRVPPNAQSLRFHEHLGFREVGTQWLADGAKQVSMQVRDL